jgi:hypothetical protein
LTGCTPPAWPMGRLALVMLTPGDCRLPAVAFSQAVKRATALGSAAPAALSAAAAEGPAAAVAAGGGVLLLLVPLPAAAAALLLAAPRTPAAAVAGNGGVLLRSLLTPAAAGTLPLPGAAAAVPDGFLAAPAPGPNLLLPAAAGPLTAGLAPAAAAAGFAPAPLGDFGGPGILEGTLGTAADTAGPSTTVLPARGERGLAPAFRPPADAADAAGLADGLLSAACLPEASESCAAGFLGEGLGLLAAAAGASGVFERVGVLLLPRPGDAGGACCPAGTSAAT